MTSLCEWIDMKIRDDDINYFDYDEFSNFEKVGEGAFGIVNKADWKSCGIKIALKIIEYNSVNQDNMNRFLKEVQYILFIFKIYYNKIYSHHHDLLY
ncbi:hypothetical protein RirG_166150 [Rhizophagus irregularis DAOM 197198w]|uniref:Protein kinase domain-containing protein n=1 Tax=Rhizophagus irregularis (strain DAOM 197198w) TaxID=1432141 RepID=A0A015IXF9_RHIIW|nr:hypothetical protein RirG_166150 [Rhizophagus irregularis DAOM 197198w]